MPGIESADEIIHGKNMGLTSITGKKFCFIVNQDSFHGTIHSSSREKDENNRWHHLFLYVTTPLYLGRKIICIGFNPETKRFFVEVEPRGEMDLLYERKIEGALVIHE